MIFDLNTTQPDKTHVGYDVCIAGAGVAGITLAIELADKGKRVLLLEGGGWEYSEISQKVYQGESIGRNYFELDQARLRFLGGTSNHWAGWCRPLDAHDFKRHDHIPNSGWPFGKPELDPYHKRTCNILEIPTEFPHHTVEGSGNIFDKITFHQSPPVRFAKKYGNTLKASKKIDLFLNANLVDIRLNENTDHVESFHCANYVEPTRRSFFTSKTYVMAMGGIENPRMLLNFHNQIPDGIGNKEGLVGRYFMEHFHALGGYYVTEKEVWPFSKEVINYAPTLAAMNKLEIANAGLQIGPLFVPGSSLYAIAKQLVCSEKIILDFIRNFKDIWCPIGTYTGGYLRVASEQVPNRDSRVSLSEQKDRFGLNRTILDWRITDIDRRTIEKVVTNFGAYMVNQDFGNVKLIDWMLDDKKNVPGVGQDEWLGAGWHHMGTTRMANTPDQGVVDKNCRIFGVDNLFLAGSSVFPTSGHANPTFTIVQLTLRLSEHLDSIFGSSTI